MHYTIEELLQGKREVADYYAAAREKWGELFAEDMRDKSVDDWANWLTRWQVTFFEQHCGGRWFGQEVMVWSGFGTLYATRAGFDDNLELAKKLAEAFEKSMCSIEVKSIARDAGESYGVME